MKTGRDSWIFFGLQQSVDGIWLPCWLKGSSGKRRVTSNALVAHFTLLKKCKTPTHNLSSHHLSFFTSLLGPHLLTLLALRSCEEKKVTIPRPVRNTPGRASKVLTKFQSRSAEITRSPN